MKVEDNNLFMASCYASLEDFLKTELSQQKHIYCSFAQDEIDWRMKKLLLKREIRSISFITGHTLYPAPIMDNEQTQQDQGRTIPCY